MISLVLGVAAAGCSSGTPAEIGLRPGVWSAVFTLANGQDTDERLEIERKGEQRTVFLAPYGKRRSPWGPIGTSHDGSIAFLWGGAADAPCALQRESPARYAGGCKGAAAPSTLVLTTIEPPHGRDLAPSDVDLAIVARAQALLSGPAVWNRHDERACEDDLEMNSWSLFCAFYQASLDVAGVYLHRRPVMELARAGVAEVTLNRQFEHPMRDYNNLDSTTWADIQALFSTTAARLKDLKHER